MGGSRAVRNESDKSSERAFRTYDAAERYKVYLCNCGCTVEEIRREGAGWVVRYIRLTDTPRRRWLNDREMATCSRARYEAELEARAALRRKQAAELEEIIGPRAPYNWPGIKK